MKKRLFLASVLASTFMISNANATPPTSEYFEITKDSADNIEYNTAPYPNAFKKVREDFEKNYLLQNTRMAVFNKKVIEMVREEIFIESPKEEDEELFSPHDKQSNINQTRLTKKYYIIKSNGELKELDVSQGKVRFNPQAFVSEKIFDQTDLITSNITDRQNLTMINNTTGASAGDGFNNFGVWFKAITSHAKQKQAKKYAGYKLNQNGFTIGADTEVSDQATLGIAYSLVNSKQKYKDDDSKLRMKSNVGTIYGGLALSDTLFTNLQVNAGRTKFKAKDEKIKARLLSSRVELGNNFDLGSSLYLTPSVALKYDQVNTKAYTEETDYKKRTFAAQKIHRTSGEFGVMLKQVNFNDDSKIIPEIHAKVFHAFSGKVKNGSYVEEINGLDIPRVGTTTSTKAPKTKYQVGGSLNFVQTKAVELGVGYDYSFRSKYKAHTGSIKARVNF